MSRHLNLADRLHEGVADDDADVGPGVAVGLAAQGHKVLVRQAGGGGAQVQLEHEGAGVLLRQRDVNTLLKPRRTHAAIRTTIAFNHTGLCTTLPIMILLLKKLVTPLRS